ncbi:uncharacterized protein [Hyperolius riggenbachi]|uniref:uncharacterized protein isoform X2 n=1 Tax=Hyperolius riggenbachi TaxID=752182 RepID=UPI0035A2BA42
MALHHRLLLWQKILLGILCFPLLPVYLCVYCLCLKNKDREKQVGGKQRDIADTVDSAVAAKDTRTKLQSTSKVTVENETASATPEAPNQRDATVSELNRDRETQQRKEGAKSQLNAHNQRTQHSQKQDKSPITCTFPWDKTNLKSLEVNLKSFERLDLRAARVNSSGTLEQLVKELTQDTNTELEKTRVIWMWICRHIEYDIGLLRTKSLVSPDPDVVLHTRKGTSTGYCSLFESMCSLAGIQCRTVSGFSKGTSHKPGQILSGDPDYTWNMVYLEGRWHLLDATWGAGHVDENISKFTFQYNEFYFLTHPALFIGEHYPEQPDCQLLETSVTRKQFEQSVHLRSHFYNLGLISSQPETAFIETDKGKVSIVLESQKNMLYIFSLNEAEDPGILSLTEHTAKFDIYPPKTGQQNIQIYCKSPSLAEVYQLVADYRIDCKTVNTKMKIPKCLHNPAGPNWLSEKSGLFHPSHKDPVIYTEDGCCTISFSTTKELSLTANLRSDEVKSIPNYILQTVREKKVEFSVHLPQAGVYVLQIFESTSGYICNYLVICQNAKVKWPPFPEALHNPVGPNPETEKAGLLHPSHLDPIIHVDNGCCTISFQINKEIKLSGSLKSEKIQTVANHILQRTAMDQVEFNIRLPQHGSYVFQIFCENKGLLCNYLMQCSNSNVKWPPFPSMLHNPVGPHPDTKIAGLHQPSHPDPIINTEDGQFTINFTTDRILNLTISLKSDDVQIPPNAMYILQSVQKQKLELSGRLPGAGSYVLKIFDTIAGYICNYLVTCSNPKVKWPPFPSSLHNPVGPNPETEKAGLIQPSHWGPIIDAEDGCFTVSFALLRDLSIFSSLHSSVVQMTPEMERRHVFQIQTSSNVQIKVRLPQAGTYVLHINIKPRNSNVYNHQCNYLITCTNAAVKWPVFPLAYTDWAETYELQEPLEGILPEDSDVFFKLRIPDVSGVRVKGKSLFPLSLSDEGFWEGKGNTANCRYMYVTISSKEDPETWIYTLQYRVGESTP